MNGRSKNHYCKIQIQIDKIVTVNKNLRISNHEDIIMIILMFKLKVVLEIKLDSRDYCSDKK